MGHRDLTLLRTRYVSPGGAHEGRLYRDKIQHGVDDFKSPY